MSYVGQQTGAQVLYTPGHHETFATSDYDHTELETALAAEGHTMIFVQPDWDNDLPSDWAEQLFHTAVQNAPTDGRPQIFAGFSFGALLSLVAVGHMERLPGRTHPIGLVAGGMSPHFKGTIPEWSRDRLRPKVFGQLSGLVMPIVACPVWLHVGEGDLPVVHDQADRVVARMRGNATKTVIPEAGHSIFDGDYIPILAGAVTGMTTRLASNKRLTA